MAASSAGATCAEHVAQMAAHGIAPIDLVAVNLYPFEATVAQGAADDECIENIDIGGPALIRAAAKNHDFVAVLTEPAQYDDGAGRDRARMAAPRWRCAGGWPARPMRAPPPMMRRSPPGSPSGAARRFPQRLAIAGTLRQTLRYGENPHQAAAFYVDRRRGRASRPRCRCRARSCPTTT